MIVFAAIIPHPPLMIPTVGGDNVRFVEKTKESVERLAQEMAQTKPDTIVIISPHGQTLADAFSINLADQFELTLKEFGDLKTKETIDADVQLIHHYKEILESTTPVVLANQPQLDHGTAVPLYFLLEPFEKKKPKVVPISPAGLDNKSHYTFGVELQQDMLNDTKKIALIASADLSHRLSEDAPAGFSHWAEKFDRTVRDSITTKKNQALIDLDQDFIDEAGECGLKSIITLLGMVNSMAYQPEIYSYEAPFGVGYMAARLKLKT